LVPDRAEAIHLAIRLARPGDLVLIAGKGHEVHQLVGQKTLAFDDRREALKALEELDV
jgi:UDP-N-acetylmuramyl tripeptide synthase